MDIDQQQGNVYVVGPRHRRDRPIFVEVSGLIQVRL